jgi:IclR family transcriptional regulator, acetate operon repressor
VSAAARALAVLEFLAMSPASVTSQEIAEALDIPKSTLSDLMGELRSLGYAQLVRRRYVPGPAMMSLGYRTTQRLGTLGGIGPWLDRLATATGETVVYAVEVGGDEDTPGMVLLVDQVVSPNPIRYVAPVGHPRPMDQTAAGQVLLAFSGRTAGPMHAKLEQVRRQGYAVNTAASGATSIAAPVRDHYGNLAGAISVTGPTNRMMDAAQRIWPVLRETVESLEQT